MRDRETHRDRRHRRQRVMEALGRPPGRGIERRHSTVAFGNEWSIEGWSCDRRGVAAIGLTEARPGVWNGVSNLAPGAPPGGGPRKERRDVR